MVIVRPAKPSDVESLEQLLREVDSFYGDTTSESAADRISQIADALFSSQPVACALLAFADDRALAGFASYSFLWPAAGVTRSLYLKELYIRQAGRRQGIGKLLMDELSVIAAKRGCSRVEWTTDSGNETAKRFYAALGAERHEGKVFYRSVLST